VDWSGKTVREAAGLFLRREIELLHDRDAGQTKNRLVYKVDAPEEKSIITMIHAPFEAPPSASLFLHLCCSFAELFRGHFSL
jgi:hypothetical protein